MLYRSGGHLIITDEVGNVRFNTAEGLFTVTDFVSSAVVGPVILPTFTIQSNWLDAGFRNTDTDYFIADVHPQATTVFGMIRTQKQGSGDTHDPMNLAWRQATGTHMVSYQTCGVWVDGSISNVLDNEINAGFVLATFFVNGGKLYLKERVLMRFYRPYDDRRQFFLTRPAIQVDFRLYVGLFV
mgnify:CR=1 FL=1